VPTYEDEDEDQPVDAGLFDDETLEEEKGIIDVHSGSDLLSIDGEPLNEW